jgi:hypothetical protein
MSIAFKRMLVLAVSAVTLALAIVPAGYAGEDDSTRTTGGSDTGSGSGGAGTGLGATASSSDDGTMVSIGLAGGGVLILTAAGLASRRRKTIAVDA